MGQSKPLVELGFSIAGVATTGIFIFLERTGMLKQRWVLAGIGILSVVLYGVAALIYIPTNWHWVIYLLLLVGIIWVLYVVSESIKKIVKGIRLHWPITFNKQRIRNSSSTVSKVKENKIMLVVNAIAGARQIIPNGHDTIVFISDENGLTSIKSLELLSILLKLQNDEKVLKLKSFPRWLLPNYDKQMGDPEYDMLKEIGVVIDQQENNFVVSIESKFDRWVKNFKSE